MSALLAILVLFGLVNQNDATEMTKAEVDKVVEANYGKVSEIGSQVIISDWDDGLAEGDPNGE